MRRRQFLQLSLEGAATAIAAPALAASPDRVPVDIDKLNAFAQEDNVYAAKLHEGLIDVKQWKKAAAAWRALVEA